MPTILFRYLSREILAPFMLGLVTFTAVLLMGRMLRLADLVVSKGVSLSEVTRLIVYLLPYFCLLTVPMALLLAILLAFSRLSADSEIIAMKASGFGIGSMLPPVLAVTAATYIMTTLIALYAFPWGNTAFKKLLVQVIENRLTLGLKEQVFNDAFPGLVLYMDRYDDDSHKMSGILIQDDRNPRQPVTIFARKGGIIADPSARAVSLQLADGSIHQQSEDGKYRILEFRNYDLRIDAGKEQKEFSLNELDMTLEEMLKNLRTGGFSKQLTMDMRLEVHRRFALPFACFVFAIIAVPLGIQNQRSGKSAGFTLSILVILSYYITLSASKTLGEKEIVHPAMAIWLPNMIFLALGTILFRQAAAERRFRLLDIAVQIFQKIRSSLSFKRAP